MSERAYYEAYDDRYRQVHQENLLWFQEAPSPIVSEILQDFSITRTHRILELGCGEGRDAFARLNDGYDLLATDVSREAIDFCRMQLPSHSHNFQILDCVTDQSTDAFDFIYAIAVLHMLVPDDDRDAFYQCIRRHLAPNGIALIGTMGDGITERQTDIQTAFDLRERIHEQSGKALCIADTSCRMVSFSAFEDELARNGLHLIRKGITSIEPDFPMMMYAVVSAT